MEAGLEHLSRGTGRHVERIVAVLKPYDRSMETARNVVRLATEPGVPDIVVVANTVRDEADRTTITEFCRAHGMRLVGEGPYDPALAKVGRSGQAPMDAAAGSPAVVAIERLSVMLGSDASIP